MQQNDDDACYVILYTTLARLARSPCVAVLATSSKTQRLLFIFHMLWQLFLFLASYYQIDYYYYQYDDRSHHDVDDLTTI